ncbi:MAG TPA: type II toxin-antitoxin system VapB family antitoxin [Thermoanaerobaculia bacterium]|nr:type II toxin-antitoxin system VapB family antitoxin [Thermoanaerobaculia bacterium]
MALYIENPETERLAAEVAELAGETETEAVRKALEERKRRLALSGSQEGRLTHWKKFLEEEIWPAIPSSVRGRRISKEEREEILA